MEPETSDILGHKTTPLVHGKQQGFFAFTQAQAVWATLIFIGAYVVGIRIWRHYLQWSERRYRLATRRRHGIPDTDLRPFNVAYADAVKKARQEENKKKQKPKPAPLPQAQGHETEQHLRNRSAMPPKPDATMRNSVVPVPGGYNTGSYQSGHQSHIRNGHGSQVNGHSSGVQQVNGVPQRTNGFTKQNLVRQPGYYDITDVDALSDNEGKKRSWDSDDDEEHESKKTKIDGDVFDDGNDHAQYDDSAPKRGSKRTAVDEGDHETVETSRSRGKRARKVVNELEADMDVDDEEMDELTPLKSSTRGRKRDRAEAGSTFGGDEDRSDVEVEGDEKTRKRRKRRTIVKRKTGGKRDEEHFSEEESPIKKGKGSPEQAVSDISMDDSTASVRSKGRNIGDEWETNGIKYKIGPNGQRLRQALVKKARQKFNMPQDSQHPDRDQHFNIYIETWLTEEEYKEAKKQRILAWQDSPNKEPLTVNTLGSYNPGKSLLWADSPNSTPAGSPAPSTSGFDRVRNHRISEVPVPPVIAYEAHIPSNRRIVSISRPVSLTESVQGPADLSESTSESPKPVAKALTKWERQDLEVRAMNRIREAKERKAAAVREERERIEREAALKAMLEKERAEKEKADKEKLDKERAEAEKKAKEAAASSPVPLITVTAPTLESLGGSSKPSEPAGSTPAPPVGNMFNRNPPPPAAPAAPSASSNTFQFAPQPSSSTPAPSSTGTATPAATSAPKNIFSFGGQPSTGTASTPATDASAPKPIAPTFSFGGAASGQQQKTESAAPSSSGTSLLARLGPQAGDSSKAPGPEAPKAQAPGNMFNQQPASNGTSTNIFGAQPASTSTNTNIFGAQPTSSSSTASGAQSSTATATPKFNFGFGAPKAPATTSATPTPAPAPAATSAFAPTNNPSSSSSLAGALGSADKPASSSGPMFSFKVPGMPASATTSNTANNGTTTPATNDTASSSSAPIAQPKFSFGATTFGGAAAAKPAENKAEAGKAPATSPFGGTVNAGSVFAAGNSNTGSVLFGGATGDSPKPASVFGNTSGGSGSTASAFGSTTKPTSVFGNTNSTSTFGSTSAFGAQTGGAQTESKEPAKSVFGNTSSPSMFGGGGTGTSAFGNTSKTISFGGGNASSSSTTPAGGFTTPAASGTTTESASTTPKPLFSFAAPTSTPTVGSTTPASTPATGGFSFKFGGTGPSASSTNSSVIPQASPFGAPAGQSVFGNLNSGSSAFGGGNIFGAASKPVEK